MTQATREWKPVVLPGGELARVIAPGATVRCVIRGQRAECVHRWTERRDGKRVALVVPRGQRAPQPVPYDALEVRIEQGEA